MYVYPRTYSRTWHNIALESRHRLFVSSYISRISRLVSKENYVYALKTRQFRATKENRESGNQTMRRLSASWPARCTRAPLVERIVDYSWGCHEKASNTRLRTLSLVDTLRDCSIVTLHCDNVQCDNSPGENWRMLGKISGDYDKSSLLFFLFPISRNFVCANKIRAIYFNSENIRRAMAFPLRLLYNDFTYYQRLLLLNIISTFEPSRGR